MSNEKGVDPKKLNAMKYWILKAEKDNIKTGEKATETMVEVIRKIIVSEAKKGF